jgi:hypothetical protein
VPTEDVFVVPVATVWIVALFVVVVPAPPLPPVPEVPLASSPHAAAERSSKSPKLVLEAFMFLPRFGV